VAHLCGQGERVGVLQVRLFRPFPAQALLDALPASAVRVAVLDRTKEPGSNGEPCSWTWSPRWPRRTPAGARGAAAGDRRPLRPVVQGAHPRHGRRDIRGTGPRQPRRRFTIGITDDVSGLSLPYDPALDIEPPSTIRAVFFGLGSDGTVGANKNTIKILGARRT
jgi:pyruvate-ferredoxin/flavodoxin oxidoreductase